MCKRYPDILYLETAFTAAKTGSDFTISLKTSFNITQSHLTTHITNENKSYRKQFKLLCVHLSTFYHIPSRVFLSESVCVCVCPLWAKFDIGWRYIALFSVASEDSQPSISFVLFHYTQQLSLCNGNGAITVAWKNTHTQVRLTEEDIRVWKNGV